MVLVGNPNIIDATHATAVFHYQCATAQAGNIVLGDVQAFVPDVAGKSYGLAELLRIGGVSLNGGASSGAVGGSGVHLNAYFGDLTGDGTINGTDVAYAFNVAEGKQTGLPAYPLVDPVIVGDFAVNNAIDAGDVTILERFTVNLPTPSIPTLPVGMSVVKLATAPAKATHPMLASQSSQSTNLVRSINDRQAARDEVFASLASGLDEIDIFGKPRKRK